MRDYNKLQKTFWKIGAVAGALAVILFFVDRTSFFRTYMTAFIFWNGIAGGCLGFLLLHQLVGGVWGETIKPYLQAAARTIPFLAVLFLPIAGGLTHIFPWMHPHEAGAHHHAPLGGKEFYLTAPAFWGRAVLYYAVLIVLSRVINTSVDKRKPGEDAGAAIQFFAGIGVFCYVMVVTFSAVDWMMSLSPDWYSSIFGLLQMIGQGLTALAFCLLWLTYGTTAHDQTKGLHDVGNLLLAFVMLWTYHSVSQLLIIWSGNLPEEITWYLVRSQGRWKIMLIALSIFHFAVPFFLLLMRGNKRKGVLISKIAVLLLLIHFIDLIWTIVPSFPSIPALFPVYQWLMWFAVGGVWLGIFTGQLKKTEAAA